MNKTERLLEALKNGEELTARQIASRFSAGNPHEMVSTLRSRGHAIYLNTRTTSKGQTQKYRLGTPTRRMVAAAFSVFGAEAFNRAA